jgi:hypothetical protein
MRDIVKPRRSRGERYKQGHGFCPTPHHKEISQEHLIPENTNKNKNKSKSKSKNKNKNKNKNKKKQKKKQKKKKKKKIK